MTLCAREVRAEAALREASRLSVRLGNKTPGFLGGLLLKFPCVAFLTTLGRVGNAAERQRQS